MKLRRAGDRALQLLLFNEEFLVSVSHQLALITSLPFVHTARRYYRLNGLVSLWDWQLVPATVAGSRKLRQTWSFRGSKSRNKVSVGEPAEGSLVKIQGPAIQTYNKCVSGGSHPLYIHKPVCTVLRSKKEEGRERECMCFAYNSLTLTLFLSPVNYKLVWICMNVRYIVGPSLANKYNTTFDNGSLGSPIDEERSETR